MARHLVTFSGPDGLASLGLERAFVVYEEGGEAIPIGRVDTPMGEKIIDYIVDHMPEGAVVYPDYSCLLRKIPLRSH